jgi:uncharacterized membrane protein YfcA
MAIWQLAVYGGVGFMMAVLSGISGAGAGFVTTPLGILLGMSPAQAVSTGKFNGLAVSVGSLSGMDKKAGSVSRRKVLPVMVLALAVGLLAPFAIKNLDSGLYRTVLAIALLLLIPVVIFKKVGIKSYHPKRWQKWAGGCLLTLSLLLQGIFSGGMGSLVNLVLMGMLGMDATEANITKRWSQLILNTTVILGMVGSGLVIWQVAAVGVTVTFSGSFLGGRLAVKRGNTFIMHIMVALMLISAIALLLSA